jgi:hypothetical protein
MTEILRVKLGWSGFTGGPGYSVFHFREWQDGTPATAHTVEMAQAAYGRVRNFAVNIGNLVPPTVTLRVEPEVEVIEDTNGQLEDVFSVTAGTAVTGSGANTTGYSAASGAVINWKTAIVRKRRRIRGRTFIVPLAQGCYEQNGTLNASALSGLQTAANTLAAVTANEPELGVYARPTRTKNTDGTWTESPDGQWAQVRSALVPDMAAILRSRRD